MRRLAAGAIVLAFVVAGTAGCASTPPAPFRVTGYASTGATTNAQLVASRKAMTMVGVDGVTLDASGASVSSVGSANLALLREAHHLHESAELLFSNYSTAIGDFDSNLVARMLNSPAARTAAIRTLAADVRSQGWDGITIDLESLNNFGAPGHTRDDNAGLVAFAKELRAALGKKSISICLSATTGSYKDLGYDLTALGHSVDHVVLMAYDQHGPSWSSAGPIGGFAWAKASLRGLTTVLPAAKIQLGIGEYGYSWPAGSVNGTPRGGGPYTDAAARALVKKDGATAHWDPTQQEWHATLHDGTTLWWSDARSFAAREALARSLHLGGVAVWSLGQGDPL
ncbi:MAG TPA: glycosyl hydrolase family 18 protein [Galbitalea sp.]|jgi:spore germination protein YaaH|nr:glycosyl hydrolase family 18 protein [Galbitalea sp.]